MKDIIFLDLDGVLVDFVEGFCKLFDAENPYNDKKNYSQWDIDELLLKQFKSNPRLSDLTLKNLWHETNNKDFWENLIPMPDINEIFHLCEEYTDEIVILTHPTGCDECLAGKAAWIRKYCPHIPYIMSQHKHYVAGPNKILLDDKSSNVEAFQQYGGKAILVPRLWNDGYLVADNVLQYLRPQLDKICRTKIVR